MNIIGIDLGSVKMGVCHIYGKFAAPKFTCKLFVSDKNETTDEKFLTMVQLAIDYIEMHWPELVVCEYPFAIQGHAKVLVEMFGAIRFYCASRGIPFLPLSQTKIKKYATGSGKDVEKSALVMRAYKEYDLELSDDQADAFWIAHVGMTYLFGSPIKFRQDSVDDIKKKMQTKIKKVRKNKK